MENLSYFFIENEKTSLFFKDGVLLETSQCAALLIEHTNLKYISVFLLEDSFYFYNEFVYHKLQLSYLHDLICSLMITIAPNIIFNRAFLEDIYWLVVNTQNISGNAPINENLISFHNGVLNVQTR